MNSVRTVLWMAVFCGLFAAAGCRSAAVASSQDVGVIRDMSVPARQVVNESERARIAILTTGGTIAMKADPQTGAAVPSVSGDALIEAVPALTNIADIEVISICNIDSSWMSPDIWLKLAASVQVVVDRIDIDGVVITHGTDTMADTAYFLDLTVNTDKPVVLTGAMRNASMPGADGPANLFSAVSQAASAEAKNWGVTVTLNNYIHSARAVRKQNSMNPQAFDSGLKGLLGTVYDGDVTRINDRLHVHHVPLPHQLAHVPLITTYVGDDGALIRASAESGAEGLVVEAFGAGNVNPLVADAIDYAVQNGVVVVMTTVCPDGGAHGEYGSKGGGAEMAKSGVILSGQLSGEKARILLSVLLGSDTPKPRLPAFF
ncbi:MAG: asparaginase [Spartobacteria bacterium]|nr:asparaginase [Spartobacteria bacterium]